MAEEASLERTLGLIYAAEWSEDVSSRLFAPEGFGTTFTIDDAYDLLDARLASALPDVLLPLCLVDEASIACVVIDDGIEGRTSGDVVRLHLNDVVRDKQLRLLDIDPLLYVHSLQEELDAREAGLVRVLDEIGPAYDATYIDNDKRPRDFVVRPVRIACQNVIVGLAAIAQDSSFDGLSAVAWQTCEVPHVAAHEANRALIALVLCDAFQRGGTMEIRFDHETRAPVGIDRRTYDGHPEGRVPASLRRFGRIHGVPLGAADPGAISPAEARELFLAITPMPLDLRARVTQAIQAFGITPERLCFTLMSQTWREIEVDFLLAATTRAGSVLEGGSAWTNRMARQEEMHVCRASLMVGMLFRRLNGTDSAGSDEMRVVEDLTRGVTWTIDEVSGSVTLHNLASGQLPWAASDSPEVKSDLTVFPRSAPSHEVIAEVRERNGVQLAALLVPADATLDPSIDVPVLRCPDRTADLDATVEAKLLTSRTSRR